LVLFVITADETLNIRHFPTEDGAVSGVAALILELLMGCPKPMSLPVGVILFLSRI
tara:strand:- start:1 stop:168 length:168 start_codon:yes stop_codon:yes gene_type:complete